MDITSHSAPKASTYTCISCHVAFKEAEAQRQHYKTDWHRYNLKRKVAELPPISAEEFQRKVLTQRTIDEQQNEDKSAYCQCCRKSFSNGNAFDNHLNSKKHKDNERNFTEPDKVLLTEEEEEEDIEEVDSDEWNEDDNPINNNNCLFCMHHSRNFIKNLEHMTIVHSFFVPDIEYCTDLQGLLMYLGEKIQDGFMCLWCNEKGRTYHSAEAARNHMLDKGHCKMLHEGLALAEYTDFYDYSSSYPDSDQQPMDQEEEVNVPELETSDYQLVLPSGATVGHRSLMRYYRQSLNPNSSALVPKTSSSTKKLHKVLAHYRSLGWSATQQEAAARKAKDLHYMKRMHAKFSMRLGVKANKLQTHFRQQVNY